MEVNQDVSTLARIKKHISTSYLYDKPNVERYNEFRNFVFNTSVTKVEEDILDEQGKPNIEANILEAYISRLCGEFSKQEPSIVVSLDEGAKVDPSVVNLVDQHLRHILFDANKNNCEYEIYRDLLSGGFSRFKVWTEYANEKSFNQVIKTDRVFDPTLCGFDILARLSHKGDGNYCFEYYPKRKEDVKAEYPDLDLSTFSMQRSESEFNWSYQNANEDIIVICDFYEKKKKPVKLLLLSNNQTITKPEYEKKLKIIKESGSPEQPPAIIKSRDTEITKIYRYRICENKILEEIETDFKFLPIVNVNGNAILLRDDTSHNVQEMTRPYVYHAKGTQKLKNFALQCLGNELENLVQHKFMIAQEALPDQEDYLDAWTDTTKANTLVHKAYCDDDPNKPLPAPQTVVRPEVPSVILNTFAMTDQLTQGILGSYDAQLGVQNSQLSGIAIVEGATQSNAAAMPFVVGLLQALTQVANIVVDLLPKYYITERELPILSKEGNKKSQTINQGGKRTFNYDENALQVKVEAGVNFQIQKARALQQIIALSQANEQFGQFINAQGLEVLLDNMEFKGVDLLREKASAWMKQMQAQQAATQQAAQAQANQPNPLVIKNQIEQAKLQQSAQEAQTEAAQKSQQMDIDRKDQLIDIMKIHSDNKRTQEELEMKKMQYNRDKMMDAHDMSHRHKLDIHDRIADLLINDKKE